VKDVPQIKAAYDWMVDTFRAEASAATQEGNAARVTQLEQFRDALERGIFVALFGQFELAVTARFEAARDARRQNTDWNVRRGWDVPSYQDRRLPFETKLTLVLDSRESANGKALQAYSSRNHFAHGGTNQPVGSIDQFVSDLYVWLGLLRG
jgi:hypothetical protein